jgi:ribokinase
VIVVDAHAENSIVVVSGANQRVDSRNLPAASVVVAQLEIPVDVVISAFRAARERGARTMLNPAPARPLPDELLALCDVVVPNEHELELIGGVRRLLDRGVGTVVTTRGAAGATVAVADGSAGWTQPPFTVSPVDSTGAGDAFCGALAARLAAGEAMDAAVAFAAAAGALATTTRGAVPSLPHLADVTALVVAGR